MAVGLILSDIQPAVPQTTVLLSVSSLISNSYAVGDLSDVVKAVLPHLLADLLLEVHLLVACFHMVFVRIAALLSINWMYFE